MTHVRFCLAHLGLMLNERSMRRWRAFAIARYFSLLLPRRYRACWRAGIFLPLPAGLPTPREDATALRAGEQTRHDFEY